MAARHSAAVWLASGKFIAFNAGRSLELSEGMVRLLALLPFLALLIGPFFLNRVTPYVLGMPFLLAWIVIWILLTAAIMAAIFRFDPANREDGE
jgi:hypothetical protein